MLLIDLRFPADLRLATKFVKSAHSIKKTNYAIFIVANSVCVFVCFITKQLLFVMLVLTTYYPGHR